MEASKNKMTQIQEKEYINRVRHGDVRAYEVLIRNNQNKIFSMVVNWVKNEADAQELTQDVFIKAYKNLHQFKENSKFSTWLYSIAYNTCMSFLRKKKLSLNSFSNDFEVADETGVESHFSSLKADEQKRYIGKALDQLGPQQKLLIQLFYLEEMSLKEIVEITNIPIGNIKSGLSRARKNLYGFLEEELKEELNSLL